MKITEEDFGFNLEAKILEIKPGSYQNFIIYICPSCNHKRILRSIGLDISPKMHQSCKCGTHLSFNITSFLQKT